MENSPLANGVRTLVPAPEGYVVNFDNPPSQKVLDHYLITGILGPLAFIALCQRYYTKLFLSKGLQVDDAFMFLAWASSVITQILMIYCITIKTLCYHIWEIPLERFLEYARVTWAAGAVFMLCNGFTKLSLLTFYLHLSPQRWFRITVWISIGIVGLYTLVITTMLLFHCTPVRKSFDPSITVGSCINVATLYIATAVSNIVTDLMLFILPIPMVLNLRMGRAQKIGAIFVFGIGTVTVVTSVIRLVYLFPVLASGDITWDAAPANIWSFLEANLFIICGSMPTLRKFFKHFAPTFMGGSSSNPSYGPARYGAGPSKSYGLGSASRGTRKQRKQCEHFPEENELRTYPTPDDSKNSNSLDRERGDGGGGGNGIVTVDVAGGLDPEADNRSDKAILQTKSFTVTYDERRI